MQKNLIKTVATSENKRQHSADVENRLFEITIGLDIFRVILQWPIIIRK